MSTGILITTPGCEIVTVRELNTRKEIVFEAWANPKHLKNWWGPKGFTNTFEEFEFRPGGKWKFVMHGPGKGNYENECEFIDIVPFELIAWDRISKPMFQVVVTFKEVENELTRLTFKMLFRSEEECNKIKLFAPGKNEENFDKLEEEIEKIKKSGVGK